MKNAIEHLKSHQSYPATYDELVAECDSLSDFSDKDKQYFKENLPKRTYNSADEVIEALGMGAGRQAHAM